MIKGESLMKILVSHLESLVNLSFDMINKMVLYCPDSLWYEKHGGYVFWQQILHTLDGILYWTRNVHGDCIGLHIDQKLYPDLEHDPEGSLSKEEIHALVRSAELHLKDFFAGRKDSWLAEISAQDNNKLNIDIIGMQLRHIQYHVGHCNCILREAGVPAVGWID
jgi:hypothetical protein